MTEITDQLDQIYLKYPHVILDKSEKVHRVMGELDSEPVIDLLEQLECPSAGEYHYSLIVDIEFIAAFKNPQQIVKLIVEKRVTFTISGDNSPPYVYIDIDAVDFLENYLPIVCEFPNYYSFTEGCDGSPRKEVTAYIECAVNLYKKLISTRPN